MGLKVELVRFGFVILFRKYFFMSFMYFSMYFYCFSWVFGSFGVFLLCFVGESHPRIFEHPRPSPTPKMCVGIPSSSRGIIYCLIQYD